MGPGLSFWHVLLVLAVVLIFFGPSRLPGLGSSLGKAIRGFKKGLNDLDLDEEDEDEREATPAREALPPGKKKTAAKKKSKNKADA